MAVKNPKSPEEIQEALWEVEAEIQGMYDEEPRLYIEQNLCIKPKEGDIMPLLLNEPQRLVYERIQKIRALGLPVRVVILKARQEGVSTLTEALMFERTARWENVTSFIIAHDPESTDNIFQMFKVFYEELDPSERPSRRYDSKKQMVFENPDQKTRHTNPGLRSKVVISTANKVRVGRGHTIQNFHGSEVAFWDNGKELMKAILQAIPDTPNTMVVLESTANGLAGKGKYFYDRVMAAAAGKGDFELIFLPWFLMDEYEKDFEDKEEKEAFKLDKYEESMIKIMKEWKITNHDQILRKLNWRRWAIENKCDGDVDTFKQEYPATIQEAFVASALLVFPKRSIEMQQKYIRKGLDMSDFERDLKAQELIDEGVVIYEKPEPGAFYTLGLDGAEGEGGDDGAFTILNAMTGREAASFASNRIPPEDIAALALKAAMYFNNSLIVPEINHPGPAMLAVFKESGYPNIYRREISDNMGNVKTRKLGWHTSRKTKRDLVTDFKAALRTEEVGLSCDSTVNQMFSYVRIQINPEHEDKYGMGAEEGAHDDRIMSAMLAYQGVKQLPIWRE